MNDRVYMNNEGSLIYCEQVSGITFRIYTAFISFFELQMSEKVLNEMAKTKEWERLE